MSKRIPRKPPQGWLIWLTVQDSPSLTEEYMAAEDVLDSVLSTNLIAGLRVTRKKIQSLPARIQKPEQASPKTS